MDTKPDAVEIPTTIEYPFQVGRMVYRTRDAAREAIQRAQEAMPRTTFPLQHRASGKFIVTCAGCGRDVGTTRYPDVANWADAEFWCRPCGGTSEPI